MSCSDTKQAGLPYIKTVVHMSQLRKKYQVPVPCCLATEFESLLSKNLVKLALMNKIWIQFNKKSFKNTSISLR